MIKSKDLSDIHESQPNWSPPRDVQPGQSPKKVKSSSPNDQKTQIPIPQLKYRIQIIRHVNQPAINQCPSNQTQSQIVQSPYLLMRQQIPMFGAPQSSSNIVAEKPQQAKEFADDEFIEPTIIKADQQKAHYDLSKNLNLQVLSQYSKGRLIKTKQYLPCLITLKTNEIAPEIFEKQEQNRVGVDLICLIDKSGSMQGEKIEMVKRALNSLLDFLSPKDRLQLITFDGNARRLTPLKTVTDENKQQFKAVISQLNADGSTSISAATGLAIKQLEERNYRNNVTSVFLLSDGQDGNAQHFFKQQLKTTQEIFTLHSFGFGSDHDAQLMTQMCALRNGGFYFVQNLSLLDEFYADAFGGLISVVGKELELRVRCRPQEPFEKIQIHNTYGQMWKNYGQDHIILLPLITSGQKKDFVFELLLPEFNYVIGDEQRLVKVVEVQLKITDAYTGQIIEKKASLELTFFNENEIINDNEENIDVATQLYRIQGIQIIDDARRACERGNHKEAEQKIDEIIDKISSQKQVSERSSDILEDLKQAKQASLKDNYRNYGHSQMVQMTYNTITQQGVNAQFNRNSEQTPQLFQSPIQNMIQFTMMQRVQISKSSKNTDT